MCIRHTIRNAAFALLALPAAAQSARADIAAQVGHANFLDESWQHHLLTGAAFRYYVSSRIALAPEFLFLYRSTSDRDYVGQMNVAYDLRPRGARTVPYVIGGFGVIHTVTSFPRLRFSTTSATGSGGFGVRFFLNGRVFIAPEARLGTEPLTRLQVSVGYQWR